MKYELLTDCLLYWYDQSRRELPWRRDTDPYRIWVSEIMLQQTRVETVIPYYLRFMQLFPDMAALSDASEEELLFAWQGLGYYSRARNLQKGVREVVARYDGKMPDSREEVLQLPGIGDYTAGAILSIAHNQPEPAIDGNVLRVVSRLRNIEKPVEKVQTRREIEAVVREMMKTNSRAGDITQALMELGALVCVPGAPRCGVCPWSSACVAQQRKVQHLIPVKKTAAPPKIVSVHTGVLISGGQVFAVKRPLKGLLAGMWEFPSVEQETADPVSSLDLLLKNRFQDLGQIVEQGPELHSLKHVFSHREWKMRIFLCTAEKADLSPLSDSRWLRAREMDQITWAGPHRKIAKWIQAEIEGAPLEKG